MASLDGADGIAPVTWIFGTDSAEPAASGTAPRESSSRPPTFDPISNVSMHALARRGMSSQEMTDHLLAREFEQESVDAEVCRLEGVALLDDVALAETLVRTLRDRKGLGQRALTTELRRRKLDSSAIDVVMNELEDDELSRAVEVARNRARQLTNLDSVTAKRRLGAFLMRRGYSGQVVSTAVSRALSPTAGPAFR